MEIMGNRIPSIPSEHKKWTRSEALIWNLCIKCWEIKPSLRPEASKLIKSLQLWLQEHKPGHWKRRLRNNERDDQILAEEKDRGRARKTRQRVEEKLRLPGEQVGGEGGTAKRKKQELEETKRQRVVPDPPAKERDDDRRREEVRWKSARDNPGYQQVLEELRGRYEHEDVLEREALHRSEKRRQWLQPVQHPRKPHGARKNEEKTHRITEMLQQPEAMPFEEPRQMASKRSNDSSLSKRTSGNRSFSRVVDTPRKGHAPPRADSNHSIRSLRNQRLFSRVDNQSWNSDPDFAHHNDQKGFSYEQLRAIEGENNGPDGELMDEVFLDDSECEAEDEIEDQVHKTGKSHSFSEGVYYRPIGALRKGVPSIILPVRMGTTDGNSSPTSNRHALSLLHHLLLGTHNLQSVCRVLILVSCSAVLSVRTKNERHRRVQERPPRRHLTLHACARRRSVLARQQRICIDTLRQMLRPCESK